MRVILNSDVVHTKYLLATGLPSHIKEFCRDVVDAKAVLVLPNTVVLEDERHQTGLWKAEVEATKRAKKTLERWGVTVGEFDAAKVVDRIDMVTALRATGANVEVCDATIEDYRDAERRAALRHPPALPKSESDEMRDLIIWAIAIRLAKQDGGALLVGRDGVHTHPRGQEEADAAGLLRASNFDDAAEYLGRSTEAGKLARTVLYPVWAALKKAGIPLPAEDAPKRISDMSFSTDSDGRLQASMTLTIGPRGGGVSTRLAIYQVDEAHVRADVSEATISGKPMAEPTMSILAEGQMAAYARPAERRLAELRHLLEGWR